VAFDTYNILKRDRVTYENIVQAMETFGIPDGVERLSKNHTDIKKDSLIPKERFIDILNKEYRATF